jgi:hypothetical protein
MEHPHQSAPQSEGSSARDEVTRDVVIKAEYVASDPSSIDLSSFSVRWTGRVNLI